MSPLLESLLKQAAELSYEEQSELIRLIAEKLGLQSPPASHKRQLSEFRGIVPYPFCGEDAQAWVSRTRQEGNEHRDQLLKGKQ